MEKRKKSYWIIAAILSILSIALNIFIVYQSCLNAADSTSSSGMVVSVLQNMINWIWPNAINEGNIDTFSGVIRKLVGHFGLFGLSGLITTTAIAYWFRPWRWNKWFIAPLSSLLTGITLAGLTEIIQLSTQGRSGEFKDVLIDSSGYLIGVLIILLIYFIIDRRRAKKLAPKE